MLSDANTIYEFACTIIESSTWTIPTSSLDIAKHGRSWQGERVQSRYTFSPDRLCREEVWLLAPVATTGDNSLYMLDWPEIGPTNQ